MMPLQVNLYIYIFLCLIFSSRALTPEGIFQAQLRHLPTTPHLVWDRFDWLSEVSILPQTESGSFDYHQTEKVKVDAISFPNLPIRVKSAMVEKIAKYEVQANYTHFASIELSFKFFVNASVKGSTVSLEGEIYLRGNGLPFLECSNCWKSSLSAQGAYSILDQDLFDPITATLFKTKNSRKRDSQQNGPDYTPVQDFIQNLIAEPANRMDSMVSSPSFGGTIRGVWLPASLLPSTGVSGKPGLINQESYTIVTSNVTCAGASCPSYIVDALTQLLPELCKPTPQLDTLKSGLFVDSAYNLKTILIRSVSSFSQMRFDCQGGTSIFMSISGSTPSESKVPMFLFENDFATAASVTKTVPYNTVGILDGSVKKADGSTLSVIKGNIFDSAFSGALVLNTFMKQPELKKMADSLFLAIRNLVQLPLTLNKQLLSLFPVDSASLVDVYLRAEGNPSVIGFFEWFGQHSEHLNTFVWPNGTISIALTSTFSSSDLLSINDTTIVSSLNAALSSLKTQLSPLITDPLLGAKFPNVSTQEEIVSTQLRASIVIDLLCEDVASAAPRVSFHQKPQAVGLMKIKVAPVGSVFESVIGTYDFNDASIFVQANIKPAFQSFLKGSRVALGSNGLPIFGGVWNSFGNILTDLQLIIKEDISSISWFSSTLSPTNIDLSKGGANSITWMSAFQQLPRVFQNNNNLDPFKLMDEIDSLLNSVVNDPSSLITVSYFTRAGANQNAEIGLNIKGYATYRNTTISSPAWDSYVDTSRVKFSFLVKTAFSFYLGAGTPQFSTSTFGKTLHRAWVAPVHYQMHSGFAQDALIDLELKFPGDTSYASITFDFESDTGGMVNATLLHSGLHSDHEAVNATFWTPGKEVLPGRVLQNLIGGGFQFANLSLNGPLNFPFPGFKKGLAMPGYTETVSITGLWLSSYFIAPAGTPLLRASLDLTKTTISSSISIQALVNSLYRFTCTLNVGRVDSLASLATGLTTAFATCQTANKKMNIGQFIRADSEMTDTDPKIGRIILNPVVRGIVTSLSFTPMSVPGFSFGSSYGTQNPIPNFGGWSDLGWIIARYFSHKKDGVKFGSYFKPSLISVSANNIPYFPEALKPYYQNLPTLQFAPSYRFQGRTTNAVNTRYSGPQFQINFQDTNTSGTINAFTSYTLDVIFDGPPVATAVFVQTNFSFDTDPASTETPVLAAPKNTFDIYIEAEHRTTNAVKYIEYYGSVTLTPGKTLINAFQTDLPAQIQDARLRGTVNISVIPSNHYLNDGDQIQIQLDPVFIDNGYIVPQKIQIFNSQLPCLNDYYANPSNTRLLFHHINVEIDSDQTIPVKQLSSKLGVMDVNSSNIAGTAKLHIGISNTEYISVSDILYSVSNKNNFFEYFKAQVGFDISYAITNLKFVRVQNLQITGTPSLVLANVNQNTNKRDEFMADGNFWEISNLADLTSRLQSSKWNVAVLNNGKEDLTYWLHHLVKLNSNAHATLVNKAKQVPAKAQDHRTSKSYLPFSSESFSTVMKKALITFLTQTGINLNAKNSSIFTTHEFCLLLKDIFSQQVCTNTKITKTQMSTSLRIVMYEESYDTTFQFNVQTLLGDSDLAKKLPIGIGSKGKASFKYKLIFDLDLIYEFNSDGIGLSLGPNLNLDIDVYFGFNDNVQVTFGPLVIPFAGVNVFVGKPFAKISVGLINNDIRLAVTGAAGLTARVKFPTQTAECQLNVQIPFIDQFLAGNLDKFKFSCVCGGNFSANSFLDFLENALMDNHLLDYFMTPSVFVDQFVTSYLLQTDFVSKKFPVLKVILPILDRQLEILLLKALRGILGYDVVQKLTDEIAKMTKNFISPNQPHTAISRRRSEAGEDGLISEKAVLTAFTKILCSVLKPMRCPPTPVNCEKRCQWVMPLGKQMVHNLANLKWNLGNTFANFNVSCIPQLLLKFNFTFTLIMDRTTGVSVHLDPRQPLFSAEAGLILNSGNCHMSGKLGFLGAAIRPDARLGVKMAISQDFVPSFSFDARMSGLLTLGFTGFGAIPAGEFEEKLTGYLYITSQITMQWSHSETHSNSVINPEVFHISDPRVCLGPTIAQFLLPIMTKLNEVYKPLDKIVGADGFLQKKVPGSEFITGKELNTGQVLHHLYRHYCEDCTWEGLFELMDVLAEIDVILKNMKTMTQAENGAACVSFLQISGFAMNFSNGNLVPKIFSQDPKKRDINQFPADKFPSFENADRNLRDATNHVFSKTCTTTGKFGIEFSFFKNTQQNIMSLMMGNYKNVPIFGITVPKVTLSMTISWAFYVWLTPPIEVEFSITCFLIIDIKDVVYTANGITDYMKSKSLSSIWKGLALRVKNDDGSPHDMIIIGIRLTGGLALDLKFVKAAVYVFIGAEAYFGLMPVNPNDKFISIVDLFNQAKINGLQNCFRITFVFPVGVGIKIQVCFWYVFGSKCLTIFKKEWQFDSLIPKIYYIPKPGNIIATAEGNVNMGILCKIRGGPERKIQIFEDQNGKRIISFSANMQSMQYQRIGEWQNTPVNTHNNPGSTCGPWTWELLGIKDAVDMTVSSEVTTVLVPQSSYPSSLVQGFALSNESLIASQTTGLKRFTNCAVLNLLEDLGQLSYGVTGNPCRTVFASIQSNFSFVGIGTEYAGPVVLTGSANTVRSEIQQRAHHVFHSHTTAGPVEGKHVFELHVPESLYRYFVRGTFGESQQMTFHSIPKTGVFATGSEQNDVFMVPNFTLMANGSLTLNGGNGVDKSILHMESSGGQYVLVDAGYLSQSTQPAGERFIGALQPNLVTFQNIEEFRISHNANTPLANFTIFPIDLGVDLMLEMSATDPYHATTTSFLGCNPFSTGLIKMRSGKHLISIGSNTIKLSSFGCVLQIIGGPGVDSTVTIDSTFDSPQDLKFEFTMGTIFVYDLENDNHFFRIFHTDVSRIIMNFGPGTHVTFVNGANQNTEFMFNFPPSSARPNTINISQSTTPILVNGDVIASIFSSPAADEDPFSFIFSYLAFSQVTAINIIGDGLYAPAQHYLIDDTCVHAASIKDRTLNQPSSWLCNELGSLGFASESCTRACPVVYLGDATIISIRTGGGEDSFEGCNINAHLTIFSNEGDDKFIIGPINPMKRSNIDTGEGNDFMDIYLPIGPSNLILNHPAAVKVVNFHQGEYHVGHFGTSLFPVGPNNNTATIAVDKWVNLAFDDKSRPCPIPKSSSTTSEFLFKRAIETTQADVSAMLSGSVVTSNNNNVETPKIFTNSNTDNIMKRYLAEDIPIVEILPCAREAPQRHYFDKNTVVIIGGKNALDSYNCGIWIDSSILANVTILIDATALTKRSRWEFDYSGTLNVFGTSTQNPNALWFQLLYINSKSVEIHFGQYGSDVFLNHPTLPTDYIFNFPNQKTVIGENYLNISSTENPILVSGNVKQVYVGLPSNSRIPLSKILGLIAISGDYNTIDVSMLGDGGQAPSQYYVIDSNCVNMREHVTMPPSTWFQEAMFRRGFPNLKDWSNCAVTYLNQVHFQIFTSDKDDVFIANEARAHLSVRLGRGDDYTSITSTSPHFNISLDLGEGDDRAVLVLPLSPFKLDLGDDQDPDVVIIHQGVFNVKQTFNIFSPVGKFDNCSLEVFHFVQHLDYVQISNKEAEPPIQG